MKYLENIKSIADLKPDYMGFIFYEASKRNFEGIIPELPKSIKKTGVFVNEHLEIVVSLVEEYQIEVVQLHGDENPDYIDQLKNYLPEIEIIKVFGVKDDFDFDQLNSYLDLVDFFLFDTKGKERGGNGIKFNWEVLRKYAFDKPFFLSGGISAHDFDEIARIKETGLPLYALDINSKFEKEPGQKNVSEVKHFHEKIRNL